MNNNSRKITDLEPISVPNADSYFVIADSNNSNKKVSYNSLKEDISGSVRQLGIYNQYPPLNDASNTLALGAEVGRKIYQNISTKIPINGSTTNVLTPINFSGTITSTTPSGSNLKEVVNVEYFKQNTLDINPFILDNNVKKKVYISENTIPKRDVLYNIYITESGILGVTVDSPDLGDGLYLYANSGKILIGSWDPDGSHASTAWIPIKSGTTISYKRVKHGNGQSSPVLTIFTLYK